MNIDQIISTIPDQEAHDHIRRKYQRELQLLGERDALEFARLRAYALADANEQDARQAKQIFLFGAIYAAALTFGVGFMIGRAL